ncbi:DMT family transporter [Companilactobacillus insicii]|uniref:DMT family transporter n=1 Tax=Companilactobacillus insicii TaxID=1732567 RepID=UPI000F79B90B|nr:multidrug efflux SMR transporter [Companilactobacillus insicii]
MDWIFLILAGCGEMSGVTALGFYSATKKKLALVSMVTSFIFSFSFLYLSLQTIPMSIGYSIWTGIGAAGGSLMNMWLFNESKSFKRFFFIFLIIVSVIGLKFVS